MDVEKALPRYLKILSKKERAKFLVNKGLVRQKVRDAYSLLEHCDLCERKCRVDRRKNKGECGVNKLIISSAFIHVGEEPFLVPSFTIFFMGCNFHCQFCQNWTISQWHERGEEITVEDLARIIEKAGSCKNVNFVGGDPTPNLPFILDALARVKTNVPVVWNSNFYMSKNAMELLKGMVDIYLTDFKYGNNACAKRLSRVDNYFELASRNHLLAFKDAELVIRHLVLPNHFECCTKPILDFIAKNFGESAIVNIMDQYRPEFNAMQFKEINRSLTIEEFNKAVSYAEELGLNFIT